MMSATMTTTMKSVFLVSFLLVFTRTTSAFTVDQSSCIEALAQLREQGTLLASAAAAGFTKIPINEASLPTVLGSTVAAVGARTATALSNSKRSTDTGDEEDKEEDSVDALPNDNEVSEEENEQVEDATLSKQEDEAGDDEIDVGGTEPSATADGGNIQLAPDPKEQFDAEMNPMKTLRRTAGDDGKEEQAQGVVPRKAFRNMRLSDSRTKEGLKDAAEVAKNAFSQIRPTELKNKKFGKALTPDPKDSVINAKPAAPATAAKESSTDGSEKKETDESVTTTVDKKEEPVKMEAGATKKDTPVESDSADADSKQIVESTSMPPDGKDQFETKRMAFASGDSRSNEGARDAAEVAKNAFQQIRPTELKNKKFGKVLPPDPKDSVINAKPAAPTPVQSSVSKAVDSKKDSSKDISETKEIAKTTTLGKKEEPVKMEAEATKKDTPVESDTSEADSKETGDANEKVTVKSTSMPPDRKDEFETKRMAFASGDSRSNEGARDAAEVAKNAFQQIRPTELKNRKFGKVLPPDPKDSVVKNGLLKAASPALTDQSPPLGSKKLAVGDEKKENVKAKEDPGKAEAAAKFEAKRMAFASGDTRSNDGARDAAEVAKNAFQQIRPTELKNKYGKVLPPDPKDSVVNSNFVKASTPAPKKLSAEGFKPLAATKENAIVKSDSSDVDDSEKKSIVETTSMPPDRKDQFETKRMAFASGDSRTNEGANDAAKLAKNAFRGMRLSDSRNNEGLKDAAEVAKNAFQDIRPTELKNKYGALQPPDPKKSVVNSDFVKASNPPESARPATVKSKKLKGSVKKETVAIPSATAEPKKAPPKAEAAPKEDALVKSDSSKPDSKQVTKKDTSKSPDPEEKAITTKSTTKVDSPAPIEAVAEKEDTISKFEANVMAFSYSDRKGFARPIQKLPDSRDPVQIDRTQGATILIPDPKGRVPRAKETPVLAQTDTTSNAAGSPEVLPDAKDVKP